MNEIAEGRRLILSNLVSNAPLYNVASPQA